ncbi:MAG: FKBP-type peptidyl-prolyl cis-trans isomerase [Halobacteriota archaeon]
MAIEPGDTVTFEYIGRFEDGTVFDTSRESVAADAGLAEEQPDRAYEPLTVEVGTGRIIEGLDEALIGLDEGDETTEVIPPERAYGEHSDEQIERFDEATFRNMVGGDLPEVGTRLRTQDGSIATVTEVGDGAVEVDFNHELAGETLAFEVEIVDVR